MLLKKSGAILMILLVMLILQGCVVSTSSVLMKTDNGFYLSIKDSAGNEIKTGASINDPEYIPELEKMYGKLVQVLDKIIKEQKQEGFFYNE